MSEERKPEFERVDHALLRERADSAGDSRFHFHLEIELPQGVTPEHANAFLNAVGDQIEGLGKNESLTCYSVSPNSVTREISQLVCGASTKGVL